MDKEMEQINRTVDYLIKNYTKDQIERFSDRFEDVQKEYNIYKRYISAWKMEPVHINIFQLCIFSSLKILR